MEKTFELYSSELTNPKDIDSCLLFEVTIDITATSDRNYDWTLEEIYAPSTSSCYKVTSLSFKDQKEIGRLGELLAHENAYEAYQDFLAEMGDRANDALKDNCHDD